jgi:hypothetical protein
MFSVDLATNMNILRAKYSVEKILHNALNAGITLLTMVLTHTPKRT